MASEILIIGAGIAGLLAARALVQAGRSVRVVDKGRGVGGRLATRRMGTAVFDHGAQMLTTARGPRDEWLEAALAAGALAAWGAAAPGGPHYRGVPAMTGLPKWLAQGLDVQLGTRVSGLRPLADGWQVELEHGNPLRAAAVVLTAPVPQALALLRSSGLPITPAQQARLEALVYDPCLAVLAVLAEPSRIPAPGWLTPAEGPLGWLSDNQQKGISAEPAVTVHATPAFSRDWWEVERAASGRRLLEYAAPWLGSRVIDFQVHGWRYARPRVTAAASAIVLDQLPLLVLAGDGFGGPDLAGAASSGRAAAAAVLTCL